MMSTNHLSRTPIYAETNIYTNGMPDGTIIGVKPDLLLKFVQGMQAIVATEVDFDGNARPLVTHSKNSLMLVMPKYISESTERETVFPYDLSDEGMHEQRGGTEYGELTAETADNMVAANLKKAETEMERAKKATGSVLSVLQRQKAAQDEVDYWKKVKKIRSQAMLQAAEEEAERTKEQRAADAARRAEIREQRRNTEMAEAGRTASERYDAAEKVEGNSVSRTIADKTKIKGHYVLVEADALTPSHDPFNNWKVSNGFPTTEDGASVNDRVYENDKAAQEFTEDIAREYDGQAVSEIPVVSSEGIVYDGNGRTMAGQIAARNNTDALYIEALMENAANFGFTEEQVQSMSHPRVVMQVEEDLPYIATTFARFNKESKKKMDNTNKAVSVAKQMTDAARDAMLEIIDRYGTLDTFFASEKAADDVVDMLIDGGFITRQEAPMFKDKNDKGQMVLSSDGRNFVTNMMLGTLFDEEAIRKLGDDKALKNSLLRAIPQIAENRRLGDYALTEEINTTIDLLYEARRSKMKWDVFKRQGNLIEGLVEDRFEPAVVLMADEMSSGVDNFRDVLTLYNKSAEVEANSGGLALFEPRTKEDIKKDIVEYYKKKRNGQSDNTEAASGAAVATETRPESAETGSAVQGTQEGDGGQRGNEADGDRRGAVAESREQRLQEERKQRILAEGTSYEKPFGLTPVSETMTPEEIGANVRRIVEGLKENEGSGAFEGFAYNGNYKKNAGHQVDEYLVSLSGVVPDETLRQWYESEGLKSRDDLRRLGEGLYGANVRSQKSEGETAKPTKEQKELTKGVVEVLKATGVPTHYVTKKGQEMLDKYRERVKLMSGGEMSERRKEREEQNRVIDEATAFVTGKSVAEARRKRLAREEKRREDAKEVYNIILSGEYNDVSLQKIRDFIDDVTPDNKYGRRLSERLPQEVERRMYERARENALDALFTRVSESTVRPNERTRPSGRRAIEAKKKELLERWEKATGNWHTDLTDFTDNTEPIGSGTDSDVYAAKDGTHVIKLSHGKPEGKRFRPDLDNIPLFNYVFPNSAYKIVGYGDFGKGFVRVLEQPIVNFSNSKPLTEQERVSTWPDLDSSP